MGRPVLDRNKLNLAFPVSRMPGLLQSGSEAACPIFVSTTVTGAQVGVTNLLVATSNGLEVGQQVVIGGLGTKTILTIPDTTHFTFSGAITTAGGEVITVVDNEPQRPIFRRLVQPIDGFITGFHIEMSAILAGTGCTVDFNAGIFDCKNDVYLSPNDLIGGLEVIGQMTSAAMVGFSGRHQQDFYFPRPQWRAAGTPLHWGCLWRKSGTITAGAFNGVTMFEPRAALKGNAGYRSALKASVVRAYSTATLAGLPASIGASFPTGWVANTAIDGTQLSLCQLSIILLINGSK